MFDIAWTEILMIAVIAIVVFPTKDLPKLLRTTGQMIGRLRRMAGDFQSQFNSALREAEREVGLSEARKQVDGLKSLNPVTDIKKALNPLRTAGEDIRRELTSDAPSKRTPSQFVPPGERAAPSDGAARVPAPKSAAPASIEAPRGDVPAPPLGQPATKAPAQEVSTAPQRKPSKPRVRATPRAGDEASPPAVSRPRPVPKPRAKAPNPPAMKASQPGKQTDPSSDGGSR